MPRARFRPSSVCHSRRTTMPLRARARSLSLSRSAVKTQEVVEAVEPLSKTPFSLSLLPGIDTTANFAFSLRFSLTTSHCCPCAPVCVSLSSPSAAQRQHPARCLSFSLSRCDKKLRRRRPCGCCTLRVCIYTHTHRYTRFVNSEAQHTTKHESGAPTDTRGVARCAGTTDDRQLAFPSLLYTDNTVLPSLPPPLLLPLPAAPRVVFPFLAPSLSRWRRAHAHRVISREFLPLSIIQTSVYM